MIFLLSLTFSCAKKVEKPVLTIGEYAKQSNQINEVVKKLINEKDVKVLNYMAEGVEATRAIPCDAIGNECNVYYEFLNKVVDLTKDGDVSEADRAILLKLEEKVVSELAKSEKQLQEDWKKYINSESKE